MTAGKDRLLIAHHGRKVPRGGRLPVHSDL